MSEKKLKKVYLYIVLAFVSFTIAFYFLAGEQLRYKESSGNVNVSEANMVSEEINKYTSVEQDFICNIDRLDSISLYFTKFYRDSKGNVTVKLLSDNRLLFSKKIDASTIPEQHNVTLEFDKVIEGYNGKTLTLQVSSDCEVNLGVSLMMRKDLDDLKFVHTIANGKNIYNRAAICFSLKGKDNIPLASYYAAIMSGVTVLLIAVLIKSFYDYRSGKANIINMAVLAIERYYFLISQLVARDFKSKYKRSTLGILWSFLNPLLTMTVQFLVFSTIFKADTQSYPVYLLTGVICFNFFRETTEMCLVSISGNARLINKVYIPKYIFPLARTISSSINLGISLVPLFLVTIIMGITLKPQALLLFYFLVCLIVFSLGIGMFLAALMVFFRDIQFLWSVLSQIWMYATPIFYTAEIIPEKYKFIVRFNPLYHFLGNVRKCLMEGISPEPMAYIYCLGFALIALAIGSIVFKKTQDKFTLYL